MTTPKKKTAKKKSVARKAASKRPSSMVNRAPEVFLPPKDVGKEPNDYIKEKVAREAEEFEKKDLVEQIGLLKNHRRQLAFRIKKQGDLLVKGMKSQQNRAALLQGIFEELDYEPVRELINLSKDPTTPPTVKMQAHKALVELMPKVHKMDTEDKKGTPVGMTVNVVSFKDMNNNRPTKEVADEDYEEFEDTSLQEEDDDE